MAEHVYHNIILNKDVDGLLTLSEREKEEFLLVLIYDYLSAKSLHEMSEVQKTLFLASRLEDTCQADALPSLAEDKEVFLALPEIKTAYEKLEAPKTAALLEELISLVPVGTVPKGDWFFEDERKELIFKIDSEICDYPDGPMCRLYIAYICDIQNAKELFLNL